MRGISSPPSLYPGVCSAVLSPPTKSEKIRHRLNHLIDLSWRCMNPTSMLSADSYLRPLFPPQPSQSLFDNRLTKFSLLCLFGRQRECGEQLHQYLDNHLIHGFCGRDLGVDLEAIEEMSDRLEQIGEGTVVIYDALHCLIRLNVTKMRAQRLDIGTHRE